jgi:hypothetical protein
MESSAFSDELVREIAAGAFGSAEPEPARTPLPNGKDEAAIAAIDVVRWNAGGPAGLAALEARNAAERQAQLRQRPQRLRPQDPAPLRAGPGSDGTTPCSSQPDNEIVFLREDDEDDANELSPTIQFILPKDETNES